MIVVIKTSMPYCEVCGTKNPPEQDELLAEFDDEYFCSDACRDKRRSSEDVAVEGYYK